MPGIIPFNVHCTSKKKVERSQGHPQVQQFAGQIHRIQKSMVLMIMVYCSKGCRLRSVKGRVQERSRKSF